MPRSNKKKHVDQRAVPTGDSTVALLFSKEQTLMINRAMVRYLDLKNGLSILDFRQVLTNMEST